MLILEAVWLKHSDRCLSHRCVDREQSAGAALIFDLAPALARSKIWTGVTVCQREADEGYMSVSARLMHRSSAL